MLAIGEPRIAGALRGGEFAALKSLFDRGERIAGRGDLAFDCGDRAFDFAVALDQLPGGSRIAGGDGPLDLGLQPPGIRTQSFCQMFKFGDETPPFLALSAAQMEKAVKQAHSVAPAARSGQLRQSMRTGRRPPTTASIQAVEMALISG